MSARLLISRRLLAGAVAGYLCSATVSADEICRFTGNTDYAGRVAVYTTVAVRGGVTQVDVIATFDSSAMFWFGVHYRIEEVSSWRGGQLENAAVNSRYLLGDHIVRQQWDNFQRATDGLQAYRVQAKTLADFRRRHPGFVQHWDPATFGRPWLSDYTSAPPERRIDLDLKVTPLPAELRSPLAMAFYWVRWLRRDSQAVPVFLPGFKKDRLVEVPIAAVGSPAGTAWQTSLHYPALLDYPTSTATARIGPDRHLLEIAFDLHTRQGSGRGTITQQGCEGAPVIPGG